VRHKSPTSRRVVITFLVNSGFLPLFHGIDPTRVNAAIRVIIIARAITIPLPNSTTSLTISFFIKYHPGAFQFLSPRSRMKSATVGKILGLPFHLLNATEPVISYRVSCYDGPRSPKKARYREPEPKEYLAATLPSYVVVTG
jgi:hypothetical protein